MDAGRLVYVLVALGMDVAAHLGKVADVVDRQVVAVPKGSKAAYAHLSAVHVVPVHGAGQWRAVKMIFLPPSGPPLSPDGGPEPACASAPASFPAQCRRPPPCGVPPPPPTPTYPAPAPACTHRPLSTDARLAALACGRPFAPACAPAPSSPAFPSPSRPSLGCRVEHRLAPRAGPMPARADSASLGCRVEHRLAPCPRIPYDLAKLGKPAHGRHAVPHHLRVLLFAAPAADLVQAEPGRLLFVLS